VNAADEYLAARVMTAPPQALHLIVVDGALRHCARAEAALEAGGGPAAAKSLEQARAFVSELIRGLDKNAAPEVVGNVASLFVFVYRRIAEAELFHAADPPRSADKIRDAAKVLRMHRETWAELLSRLNSAPATAAEAPMAAEPPVAVPAPHAARRIPSGYDDYQPRSWSG
jgi:flagellar biosynthetic protein FliS